MPPMRLSVGVNFTPVTMAWSLAPVYDRERLPAGAIFDGPALAEEATTTIVVCAGQQASVDRFGLLSIEERGRAPPAVLKSEGRRRHSLN